MTRKEILSAAKPILSNTETVRAIMDDRKTVTRRAIKLKYSNTHIQWHKDKYGKCLVEMQNDVEGETYGVREDGTHWHHLLAMRELKPPYKVGDILYVRETWGISTMDYDDKMIGIIYKASQNKKEWGYRNVKFPNDKFEKLYNSMAENSPDWRPCIHMPKEATRIFLRITNVRVEQLQDITEEQAKAEGAEPFMMTADVDKPDGEKRWKEMLPALSMFPALWNSTVKKSDLDKYGWNANPWVWVIKFEKVEVSE